MRRRVRLLTPFPGCLSHVCSLARSYWFHAVSSLSDPRNRPGRPISRRCRSVMGDGHEFMRFSELGGGPPLIDGRARRAIARPARRTGSPDPHDPEKALRRFRARADGPGAVSRGFRGAQHSTWRLLYTPVKEEKNFIFS
jgi:hypothetical protein